MNSRFFSNFGWNENRLLWMTLAVSISLHLGIVGLSRLNFAIPPKKTIEIDLTAVARPSSSVAQKQAAPPQPKPAPKPKKWLRPNPEHPAPAKPEATPAPAPTPMPTSPAAPSSAPINGEAAVGLLSRLPQLLNLSDLKKIQDKFYPSEERARFQGGIVILDIHLDVDGHVVSTDVVQSAGPSFDQAAQRVAKLLRFTPAYMGSQKVSVKIRQAIEFKSEDE